MRTVYFVVITVTLLLYLAACARLSEQNIEQDKTVVLPRNLVLLSSDTPADVRVSYCEVYDGTSNKLVTRDVRTPYLLDMGSAVVRYDSVHRGLKDPCSKKLAVKDAYKKVKPSVLLDVGGAVYFVLENLSEQTIKFAIVGVQKLVTTRDDELDVIKSHPSPIYKGVPLLYLLKPETAPNKTLYFEHSQAHNSMQQTQLKGKSEYAKIEFYSRQLGEFSSTELPLSIDKILSLYENESQHLHLNYVSYSHELHGEMGLNRDFQLLKASDVCLFRHIAPKEKLRNRGELPLLPISFEEQRGLHWKSFVVENW